MIMALDTETTGLCTKPRCFNAFYPYSISKYYDSSRVIQLGCVLYTNSGLVAESREWLIKPDSFVINNSYIHGITTDEAVQKGLEFSQVAQEFNEFLSKTTFADEANFGNDQLSTILQDEIYLYIHLYLRLKHA